MEFNPVIIASITIFTKYLPYAFGVSMLAKCGGTGYGAILLGCITKDVRYWQFTH